MKEKICIGKIVKTIGIKGEVKVIGYTDSNKRFKQLKNFYIENVDGKFECEKASIRNDFVSIKIKDVNSPEQATIYKNKFIYVDRQDAVKLKDGQYFICDLVGCKLFDENNNIVGEITDIENYGASDIILFEKNNNSYSVPFIDGIFKNVDIENEKIVVSDRFFEVLV